MKKHLLSFILSVLAWNCFSTLSVISSTNATCNGTCNAAVTFSISGGTPPYAIIMGGTGSSCSGTLAPIFVSGSTVTVNNLCACTYTAMAFDSFSTSVGATNFALTQPAPIVSTTSQTNICCFGNCNGAAQVVSSGGTPPFLYIWSPGGLTGPSVTNLCAGNYTITGADSKGCTFTKTVTITQPLTPLSVNATVTAASCGTCCNGVINAGASGGMGSGYTYTIAPPGWAGSTYSTACPGSYTICVKDACGCLTCNTASVGFSSGVNELSGHNSLIDVYPNPASDKIIFKTDLKDFFVEVVDSREKLVKQEKVNESTLNVSDVAEGIYILNIKTGEATLRKQIVIAR